MQLPTDQNRSQRHDVEQLLGKRLARWLSPYPDEVGWLLSCSIFVVKATICITLFWGLVDLVFAKELGDRLALGLVSAGLGAIFLGWSIPSDS